MYLRSTLCWIVLWSVGFSSGSGIPKFNFSLNSLQNDTGEWYGEVRLSHEGKQPWEVYLDHTTLKINGTETVAFVAKIIPPKFGENVSIKENCTNETQVSPPPGYMKLDGFGYYKIFTEEVNWTKAVEICEKEGTHLLILNSYDEARVIWPLIPLMRYHWNGFHDLYVEGQLVTIFNETLQSTGYMDWIYGLSNNRDSRDCGAFLHENDYNGLKVIQCYYKRPFICEQEFSIFQNCKTED